MGAPVPGGPQQQQQGNSLWPAADEDSTTEALVGTKDQVKDQCSLPSSSHDAATAVAATQQQGWFLHRLVWGSGVCCVLVAAFIFSIAAVLVKLTAGRVPVLEITLIRSGISLVVSAGLIKAKGIKPVLGHSHNIKWLIPRGIFGSLAMTTFYAAILLLPLADGMTLFFLNPCLTALAAWALRGEPLGLLGFAGCGISLLGMVVLVHPPMIFGGHAQWGLRRIWGTAFGLFSAICCAGAFISIRFIGKSEPAIVVALYFHTSTAILSALPLAFGWPQAWQPLSLFDASMLLGVAAGSFLGQLFMTRAMQLENASLASSLNFSQVLYSYMFGILFLEEHLTLFGILGSLLVALGMVCVTKRPKEATGGSSVAEAAAADPSSSGPMRRLVSMTEQMMRINSFKRLLSRNRAAAEEQDRLGTSVSPAQYEGLPLVSSGSVLSSIGSLGEQQQSTARLGLKQQQQQAQWQQQEEEGGGSDVRAQPRADQNAGRAASNALLQQQQQQHYHHNPHQQYEQVVLGPVLHQQIELPVAAAHGVHHRDIQLPSSSFGYPPAAGQQLRQLQRQQLHSLVQHDSGDAVVLAPLQPEPAAGAYQPAAQGLDHSKYQQN